MPWFPDFVSAVELARRQTRAVGRADPARQYFTALSRGETAGLETVWPGRVVVYDPRAGEIRGHRRLQRFIHDNQVWLAERRARIETVAATSANGRAVLETLAHLEQTAGQQAWPVAVVAESPDDESVEFRTYCSQVPVDGRRHLRPPILKPSPVQLGDAVGRYLTGLAAGDIEGVLETFAPDGYLRLPVGPDASLRGGQELRAFFTDWLSTGGIALEVCAVTDDGVRCAVEFNCVRWGSHALPPQAGLMVFERGPTGLLVAIRQYDDVDSLGAGTTEPKA